MSSDALGPGDTAVTSRDPTRLLLELNPQDRRKRPEENLLIIKRREEL